MVLVLLAPTLARPNQPDVAPPSSVVAVPTFENAGRATTNFRAAGLSAKSLTAWRDNADRRDKSGKAPDPTPGYTLTSTVVIELDNPAVTPAALLQAATAAGATLTTDANIPGFITIDSAAPTWNVQSASSFALSARRIPGLKGAFLDLRVPLAPRTLPTDPLFSNEWHLHNTVDPLFDVNAEPAWDAGYTGQGVVIGIVDQGWQITHLDLAAAYNATASQTGGTSDSHATSCAGVAGARANNNEGVAGLAYDAQLAKLYYGSSATNAAAFAFRNDLNHIKSNSWGPSDNGLISSMPSNERTAITTAVTSGRGGLGEVFVWAAGNGFFNNDRVDYDPYASSRFTISVGAIDNLDRRSLYSEPGSALLLCAQSDHDLGTSSDTGIWTTIPINTYTSSFGGTSSACPLAAAAVALILHANPNLSYRDVQHILVRSARHCDPTNPGWLPNAAGHLVNYEYGYGAVDAGAATALAASWHNVGPQITDTSGTLTVSTSIPNNNPTGISRSTTLLSNLVIEHVEVVLNVSHTFVGDLRIILTAPSGTQSILAAPRSDPTDNYVNFIFTSRRHWDELSAGTWTLTISDEAPSDLGTWSNWRLNIYGTTPPCPSDWNHDSLVNSQDFFDFIAAFFSGDADFNRNGVTDSQDFFDFLAAFFSGC